MAKLPNFLVIIRSEKLSGKGQGRGVGVRKKERFVLGKRTFRSQKSKHFVLRIIDDIIEIELLDKTGELISKEKLSKGEQQLYATAILNALVEESGIEFPVFIDSPLQKFDSIHSRNIITKFYPSVSKQVVIFPLLGKELSEDEYNALLPNVNRVYVIENEDGCSSFKKIVPNKLFETLS